MATFDELRAIKRKHSADLLKRPGVNGVDIDVDGSGEARLVVHLNDRNPQNRNDLPSQLDGHPVTYVCIGSIEKQKEADEKGGIN
jgi:hypothetical protein